MNSGWIGGIIGSIIGVAGGVIGTYCSIKNTNGPKERAFMIKASCAFWIFGIVFLTLLFLLPSPYKYLLWLPYCIVFPISIRVMNKQLTKIRQDES